ncbi:MAG: LysR substrate-binding domain-containing protein [Sodalis sp. (in: enterobacteria)]|uniref:LysR substrate-binding domain-containing protein n=1 Tax=Sodalis sp. (in: enterobacteria) TaxID=1898979 RepID=UPI003F2C990C
MRLRHIEIIHAIMASGSISGAARRLKRLAAQHQPRARPCRTATRFRLVRQAAFRPVPPTPRAPRLMPEIDQLYLHLQRIDQLAQRLRETQTQQLRIGAAHAMGQVFMVQVLMDYRRLAPPLSAEVKLVTGHQDTLCQDLLADRLDLALAFGQSVAPGLTTEVLYRADMVALIPSSLTVATPVSLAQICEHYLLMMQPQDPLGRVVYRALQAQGLRSRGTLQIKTYSVIADMVLTVSGVGIVDTFIASCYAAQLQVVAIQEALPFKVQWLTTASQAAEPAVLLMRSIICRQREPWRDTSHCARTRDIRADWLQPSRRR